MAGSAIKRRLTGGFFENLSLSSIFKDESYRKPADVWLIVTVGCLVALSILMVYSTTAVLAVSGEGASTSYLKKHVLNCIIGLVGASALANINLAWLKKNSGLLFMFCLFLMVLVLIPGLGMVAGGARRWLSLGGFRFQPGELLKVIFVIYMASYAVRHKDRLSTFSKGVVTPILVLAICVGLLLMQPDFGSSAVLFLVTGCILFVSGSSLKHLFGVGFAGGLAASALIFSSPYRMRRVQAFLNPFDDPGNSGYQLIQSLIAVGSGGATGAGLGGGEQKLFYLPAAHTDFIFAVVGEEFGFAGSVFVILLFTVFAWRGLKIVSEHAGSTYISALAMGLTALIVIPAFLNVGVVTGLLPTKGMVLPLMGYGGTAMIVNLAVVGLLVRLSREATD